ncbi:hypothetical protein T492DRAFT_1130104 [Pavlovales sp. CCMP2436]|nr:hypothetical protein T492DRAFT_1130104 [Pavlovales sp. CCMP2436]
MRTVIVTPAYDPDAVSNVTAKRNPVFTSESTIYTDSNRANANGWRVSSTQPFQQTGDNEAYFAFDSSSESRFTCIYHAVDASGNVRPDIGTGTVWLQMEYTTPVTLKAFVMSRSDVVWSQMIAWTLLASNDGTVFDDIESYAFSKWGPVETFLVSTAHQPYRHWRFKATKKLPDSNQDRRIIRIYNLQLFTGWSVGRLALSSTLPVDTSSFKLVLADTDGRPMDMRNSPIPWAFHIVIFKEGSVANVGLYTFAHTGEEVAGIFTKH